MDFLFQAIDFKIIVMNSVQQEVAYAHISLLSVGRHRLSIERHSKSQDWTQKSISIDAHLAVKLVEFISMGVRLSNVFKISDKSSQVVWEAMYLIGQIITAQTIDVIIRLHKCNVHLARIE